MPANQVYPDSLGPVCTSREDWPAVELYKYRRDPSSNLFQPTSATFERSIPFQVRMAITPSTISNEIQWPSVAIQLRQAAAPPCKGLPSS
ncbi:hypothetical protein PM082_016164 [Marasmius tenuissimus]|nr:hypothetical protein PM082_016164 [Marasmius tenuissimus]